VAASYHKFRPDLEEFKNLAKQNIVNLAAFLTIASSLIILLRRHGIWKATTPESNMPSESTNSTPPLSSKSCSSPPSSETKGRTRTGSGSEVEVDKLIPTIKPEDIISTLQEVATQDVNEFKWITAGRKLLGCEDALQRGGDFITPAIREGSNRFLSLPIMKQVRQRYSEGYACIQDMNAAGNDWRFYKRSKDGADISSKYAEDGSLWIKVDGPVKCKPESCAAIWREGNLYKNWFPHSQYSTILHSYSDTDIVLHFGGANPLGDSEVIVRAWGINHFEEGFFLILGHSVYEYNGENGMTKVHKKKMMTRRNHINALQIMVEPLSETETRVCMIQSVGLPIPLPRAFLEWLLGHVFCDLLTAMTRVAQANEEEGSKVSER